MREAAGRGTGHLGRWSPKARSASRRRLRLAAICVVLLSSALADRLAAQGLLTAEERAARAGPQGSGVQMPFFAIEAADELRLSEAARTEIAVEWAITENRFPALRSMQTNILEAAAKEGHPRAASALADMAANGSGPDAAPRAFRFMLIAAQAGSLEAQYRVAQMLAGGNGVAQNLDLAAEWLTLAARGSHAGARQLARKARIERHPGQATIEELNRLGRDEKAFQAWHEFALTGSPIAATQVAMRRLLGAGVQANHAEAARWLLLAAKHGYAPAMHLIGRGYAAGEGFPKNIGEALFWLRSATAKAERDFRKTVEADLKAVEEQAPPAIGQAARVLSAPPRFERSAVP
jgi:TPR repeat protein